MADNEPTQAELEDWAAGLKNSWLHCRTYGCAKTPSTVTPEVLEGSRKKVWLITLVCKNKCGNYWTQFVDPDTGTAITRLRKQYVPGYLAKGIGRIDESKKGALRLEYIQRQADRLLSEGTG